MPILAEVYNLGTPEYYAVAVVKIRDDDSELIYLKRRKSCHSGEYLYVRAVGEIFR